jgi:hypothetical protein
MQVTITYVAGHTPASETFTGCTGYSRDGNWISFTGTGAGGETWIFDISVRLVDKVTRTPAGG